MAKRKRRLTESEIKFVQQWLEGASQGMKPSIRAIARRLGVTRSSVIKSLGGWEGIERNRPDREVVRKVIDRNVSSPAIIEPFQVDISDKMK